MSSEPRTTDDSQSNEQLARLLVEASQELAARRQALVEDEEDIPFLTQDTLQWCKMTLAGLMNDLERTYAKVHLLQLYLAETASTSNEIALGQIISGGKL